MVKIAATSETLYIRSVLDVCDCIILKKLLPVDPRVLLVGEDSEETDANDKGTGDITLLLLVLDVADGGRDEEDFTEDDEDADPDAGTILVDSAEGLEKVDDSREDDPAVPEREGSMDEELVVPAGGREVLLEVVYLMHEKNRFDYKKKFSQCGHTYRRRTRPTTRQTGQR